MIDRGSVVEHPFGTGGADGGVLLVLRFDHWPVQQGGSVFAVLMCVDCLASRGHGTGPYPGMTRAQMWAGLDLLPTWVSETKAAANRRVIAVIRQRLAAGEQVARMYQEPGAGVAGAAS